MPIKEETEQDFLRLLLAAATPVEVVWLRLRSHVSTHTSKEHMDAVYTYFDEVSDRHFDGLIITGAPVEHLPFEEVDYWPELCQIFSWARANVRSTLYICWAAQAGLYFHYGIQKHPIPKKMFGIFPQRVLQASEPLFRGFDDEFFMPHSRHTEIRTADVEAIADLLTLVVSPISGLSICRSRSHDDFFITGHMEYHARTLHNEYLRDRGKRDDVDLPKNYYRDDNPEAEVLVTWRAHAHLLYHNWLKLLK